MSIDYRLLFVAFPFGDAVHGLRKENLGLKDQRLAMRWIQENIAVFGEDPAKVTIMGER